MYYVNVCMYVCMTVLSNIHLLIWCAEVYMYGGQRTNTEGCFLHHVILSMELTLSGLAETVFTKSP